MEKEHYQTEKKKEHECNFVFVGNIVINHVFYKVFKCSCGEQNLKACL